MPALREGAHLQELETRSDASRGRVPRAVITSTRRRERSTTSPRLRCTCGSTRSISCQYAMWDFREAIGAGDRGQLQDRTQDAAPHPHRTDGAGLPGAALRDSRDGRDRHWRKAPNGTSDGCNVPKGLSPTRRSPELGTPLESRPSLRWSSAKDKSMRRSSRIVDVNRCDRATRARHSWRGRVHRRVSPT